MKSLIYVAMLITILACKDNPTANENAGADKTSAKPEPADVAIVDERRLENIEDIKSEFADIENRLSTRSIDSTSFRYNCHDEKSGSVAYFSEGNQLRMIRHIYSEYSHFTAIDEYYIKGEALFFVSTNHRSWSFIDGGQTKDDITEMRHYIIDSKPAKCLQKKYTILSGSPNQTIPAVPQNQEVSCGSFAKISNDFQLFYKLRNQKTDMGCLDGK